MSWGGAIRRTAAILTGALFLTSVAPAYYYYIHFPNRASFLPAPEKFDLSALRNKTVYYYVSDNGPSQYLAGDSFAAFVSEIRLAAKTWNDVGSSDLRLAFGGLASAGTPQNSPGIDIVFDDDIPPGIAALAGPTTCVQAGAAANCAVAGGSGSPFIPITRSTLHIRRDLTVWPSSVTPSASYSEDSFTTLVHELGHTIGLQHTLTSSTMSTAITRATTKANPLSADDIAAVSALYPTGNFLAQTGTISGRVTLAGAPVNMASVVAIATNGPAVSSLTNPDGSYTIQGLPIGPAYFVYVHPLPPPTSAESKPANVEPPKDADGFSLTPNVSAFETIFYPGVKDTGLATPLFVGPGEVKTGVNFTVTRRGSVAISSVTTYGYPGQYGIHPAPVLFPSVLPADFRGVSIVAAGSGLVSGSSLVPGLGLNVLGQAGANVINNSVRFYRDGYMLFGLAPTFGSTAGPRHLLFSANNDIYVLPAAVLVVDRAAPTVSGLSIGTDDRGARTVQVSGTNLDLNTRILFDGAPASIFRQNPDGSLVVYPPPANPGYRAAVVALNSDGQSSLFIQPTAPAYIYDPGDAPFISVNPSSLPAGSEAMVEITGVNTNFVDGQAVIGFGSSDIAVRRMWVTGPNRMLANVSVSAAAPTTAVEVTAASALQLVSQPFGFQILSPNSRQIVMTPPILNAATGAPGVYAGGAAIVSVSNLTAAPGAIALTVGDQRANVLSVANGQITFQLPAGLPLGPAVVRLQVPSGDAVLPIVMNIDPPPPTIIAAYSGPGTAADASHPVFRGSLTGFAVSGLPDPSTLGDFSSVRVNIGGLDHSVVSATAQNGAVLLQVLVNPSVQAGAQVPVTVSYNGALSQPFAIPVR